MKKIGDKRFGLSRETIRELTTPEDKNALRLVVGGSCNITPSSSHKVNCAPGD